MDRLFQILTLDRIVRLNFIKINLIFSILFLSSFLLGAYKTEAVPIWMYNFGSAGSGNSQFSNSFGLDITSGGTIVVADRNNSRVQTFNSNNSGGYLSQFGSAGSGNGQLSFDNDVTVASNGNIIVADSSNQRIQIFNSSGTYLSKFGSLGSGNGQFTNPYGVMVDNNSGNILVADTGNNRVQIFNSSGTYLSQFGTSGSGNGQFNGPVKVAVFSNGNIAVADANNARVQIFNSSGTYLSQFGSSGSGNGQFSWGGANTPGGLRIAQNGNIVTADTNNCRVQIFDSSGNYISQFGSNGSGNGQFYIPHACAVGIDGKIIVDDSNNSRIVVLFDPTLWTTAATSTLPSLPLNQSLTLGNSYNLTVSGTTTLSAGSALTLNSGSSFTTSTLTMDGGSLTNNNGTLSLAPSSMNITSNNATIRSGSGSNLQLSTGITGAGSLTVSGGTGTVTLSGSNSYSGGTTVSAGILQGTTSSLQGNIANNAAVIINQASNGSYAGIMSGTGGLTVQGGGTVTLSGANTYSGGTTVSAGTLEGTTSSLKGNIVNNAAVIINQASNGSYAGIMSGTGGLTVEGGGTVTLNAANTYSGGTTVSGGALNIGVANSLPSGSALSLASGANLNLQNYNQTIGDLSGGGTVALGSGNLTVGTATPSTTFSGAIGGTGSVIKQGSGTLILSGTNTYSGGTTVSSGILQGTTSSLQGNVTNNAGVIFNQASSGNYTGVMSGSGGLTVNGSGTVTLSGVNTYSGGTTVSVGTLQAGVINALPSGGAVSLASGTNLNLQNYNQTIGDLTGSGTIALGSANLTVGTATPSTTFSGVIGGTGGVVKQGSGTVTLSGANTYSGGTTVSVGTLQAGVINALPSSGAINLASGTNLNLQNYNQTIGDLSGSGTVALGSANLTMGTATPSTTFSGVIGGTGGVVKQGSGTVILSGANTYSGGTTVSVGTLQAGAINALPSGGAVSLASGANLNLQNYNQTIGDLSGGGTVALGSGNLTVGTATPSTTFSGAIGGTGSVIKQGSGTLILSGTNTYSAGTTVSSGILQGTTSSLQGNITNNAGVIFNQASSGNYTGVMSGSGGLTVNGSGTVTLSGVNTYSGGTTVSVGTLQAGALNALPSGGAVSLASGTNLNLQNYNQTIGDLTGSGTVALGSANLTMGTATPSTTFSGVIGGTGGVVKQGSGTVILSGANTYSGGTTVSVGTLQAGVINALPSSGAVSLASGTNLNLQNYNQTIGDLSGSGTVALGSANLTMGTATPSTTFSGVIGGTGGVIKQGSGTVILSGANTYSGGTTVSVGALQAGVINALPSSGAISLASGTNLNLQNYNQTIGDLTGGGTVALGSANLTVGTATPSTTFSGAIGGTGSVIKQGSGTLILSGTNTYSGGTTVSVGTLQAGALNALPSAGAVSLASGTNLNLQNYNQTIGDLTGGGTVALGSANLTVGTATPSTTFSGAIGGTGSVIKQGSGTLILSGTNTYSGGSTVSSGILQGTTSSLQGNVTNNAGVIFNQASSGNYAGVMSGTGGLTVNGAGTVTLSGANTYSGGTTVSLGVLAAGASNTLPSTGIVSLASGTNLNLQGYSQTIGDLTGSGNVALGSGNLTIGTATPSAIFSGVIGGAGGVIKQGSGTVTLSGTNTYSGGTTVSLGVLQGTTSSLQGNISNNAGVIFNQASSGNYAGIMSGSGNLTVNGGGTVTLSGANTYSGGTTVSVGTLQAGALNALPSGGAVSLASGTNLNLQNYNQTIGDLTGGGSVALGSANLTMGTLTPSTTFSGVIGGTGGVVKQGSGTVTLSGANTYSGGTTVSVGTLQAGALNALPSGGAVSLASGTNLSLQNYNQTIGDLTGGGTVALGSANLTMGTATPSTTFSGAVGGTGSVIKQGSGTLILSGTNTYSGGTTVSGGILQGTTSSLQGNITNNAGVSFNQASSGNYSGVMSGSGGLTVNSGGTVTLSGANTYSGGTTVSSGILEGTTSSLQGDITNNAGVIINQPANGSYAGIISGSGSLTTNGAGTITLTGANTYSGGTTVSAGTLQAGALNVLPSGGAFSLAGGTNLNLQNYNQTIGDLTGSGTVALGSANLTLGTANSTTFSGIIGGTGSVIKQGSGTLTLSGANTYSGGTTISLGVLQTGVANALPSTGVLNLASGANLSLQYYNQIIGDLIGSGAIALGSGNLTMGTATPSTTFSGVIGGTGGVVKQGSGTVILSGVNNYSGGTTVSAGILQGTTDSLQGNIINNAEVVLQQASNGSYAGIMSGSGSLTIQGGGTVTLTANNSYSGGTTVVAGTLQGTTTSLRGNITNDSQVTFNQASNGTYAGIISGNGGLTIQGGGTVNLTGNNSYTGGTTVSLGILEIGVVDALPSSGTLSIASGADLNLQNYNQTIGDLTGDGAIALGSANLTLGTANNSTFSGIIGGAGSLIKQGAGTLVLTGSNNYTGGTVVSLGVLQGTTDSLQGNIDNNAQVIFNQPSNGSYAGVMSGTGNLTINGGGTITLSANNSYSGGTNISVGLLQGTTSSLQGNITNNSGVIFNQASSGNYAGIMSGTGNLTVNGAGTVTLSGANTYSGGTTLSLGVLQTGVLNALPSSGAVSLASGTNLNLQNYNQTIGDLTGSGTVALGSANLTMGTATPSTTFSGSIGGTGGVVKQGSGTVTLSGANTYSGGTTVSVGTLQAGALNALPSSGAVSLASGTNLNLQNYNQTIGDLTGGGTIALGSANLTMGTATPSTTFSGVIGGTGSVIKQGSGTVILSGANTYSGGTTVSVGTLQAGGLNALPSGGALSLASGTNLNLQNYNQTIGDLSGSGAVVLGSANLTMGTATPSTTFSGVIGGTGSVVKQGSGTVILSGTNTYSGGTTVSSGILQGTTSSLQGNITNNAGVSFNQASNGNYAGIMSGTGGLTVGGTGTVTLSGANTYSGGTTVSSGILQGTTTSLQGNITNNAGVIINQPANGSYLGVMSGSGSLTTNGAGTITLTGANTYSGGTTVSLGTLQAGALNALPSSGAVSLAGGTNLNLQNYNQTIGDLTGSGTVALGSANLTLGTANSTTFSGIIGGTGSVIKQGSGTLTLSGANTYSGGTTISSGTLQVTTNSLQGNVDNNAVVIFNQAGNGTYAGIMTGSGNLNIQSAGTITLTGNNNYYGGTTVAAGILKGTTDSLQGNIVNNSQVIFNQANNGMYTGVMSGSGSLLIAGGGRGLGGTVILSGANTYSGGTTISDGTLEGSTTSLQGNIVNNSVLIFDQTLSAMTANNTVNATITGNGTTDFDNGTFVLNTPLTQATLNIGAGANSVGMTIQSPVTASTFVGSNGSVTLNSNIIGNLTNDGSLTINGIPTVSGQYTQQVNSILNIPLISTAASANKLVVSSSILDPNSTLNVILPNNGVAILEGDVFTVLTSTNNAPTSVQVTSPSLLLLRFVEQISGNNIQLTATRTPITQVTTSNIATSVGAILEEQRQNANFHQVLQEIDALETPLEINDTLVDIPPFVDSPTVVTNARQRLFNKIESHQTAGRRHALLNKGYSAGDEGSDTKLIPIIYGSKGKQKAISSNVLPYKLGSLGFGLMVEKNITSDVKLGLGSSYARTVVKINNSQLTPNIANIGHYQGFMYGSFIKDSYFLDGTILAEKDLYYSQRHVSVNNLQLTNIAKYNGVQYAGKVRTGYSFAIEQVKHFALFPMISLQHGYIHKNAYTEYGGGAISAIVNQQHNSFTEGGLGAGAIKNFYSEENLETSLDVYIMYLKTLNAKSPVITSSFVGGGSSFNISGAVPSSNGVETGLHLSHHLNDRLSLTTIYSLTIKKGFQNHFGSLRFNCSI